MGEDDTRGRFRKSVRATGGFDAGTDGGDLDCGSI